MMCVHVGGCVVYVCGVVCECGVVWCVYVGVVVCVSVCVVIIGQSLVLVFALHHV